MVEAVIDGSGWQAVRLQLGTLDPDDLDAWRRLADRAIEPNPFFRPEFVLANVIERGARARLLVLRDGSRWLACLPYRTMRPSARLPLPSLEALTDSYSFCGTPLIDRDAVALAAGAFVDVVLTERRAAVLALGMFSPDGPVADALAAAAAARGIRPIVYSAYERAAWHRSAGTSFPGPSFDRTDRRELARRARLLSSELGGELEVIDHSNEPEAWEAFLSMENSGWKAAWGTAIGSTSVDTAFFRRMCAGMSAAGHLEVVTLEVAGRPVAMECHLVDGDVLYSFKIAHDPDFRRFSPGTQLKYRVIERFRARGLRMADSCAVPQNAHMNRLWPERRRMQTLLLPTGAWSAGFLRPAMLLRAAARQARDTVLQRGRSRSG